MRGAPGSPRLAVTAPSFSASSKDHNTALVCGSRLFGVVLFPYLYWMITQRLPGQKFLTDHNKSCVSDSSEWKMCSRKVFSLKSLEVGSEAGLHYAPKVRKQSLVRTCPLPFVWHYWRDFSMALRDTLRTWQPTTPLMSHTCSACTSEVTTTAVPRLEAWASLTQP